MEILCLNIRLLSESDLWVQNSVNKESYVDLSMFPTNFLALQQNTLNFTSSFLGNRELIEHYYSEMLIELRTYHFPFPYGSMVVLYSRRIIPLKELGEIIVFANMSCFYRVER